MRTDTEKDMSTSVSRRVRYAVPAPGRRLSWTTCPSIQQVDILSTYSPILADNSRTGHGCSAEVSAGALGQRGHALMLRIAPT